MSWYLKRSLSLGPVRFNLSKSGVGYSVGVKGFRIGVKPNGKNYVRAGRDGFFYYDEFGKGTKGAFANNIPHASDYSVLTSDLKTTFYKKASTSQFTSSRKELLKQLIKSYKKVRLDYVSGIICGICSIALFFYNNKIGVSALVLGIVIFSLLHILERKQRTILLFYDLDDEGFSSFKKTIDAYNHIANCGELFSYVSSTSVCGTHMSKLHAGAGSVISTFPVKVGESNPPWVKSNISIPSIKVGEQQIFFLPDGIFIYDNEGVAIVDYDKLNLEYSVFTYLTEAPPKDAIIVGHSWRYPNKNGLPDRRFGINYRIPECSYGNLKISTEDSLILYIATSNPQAPKDFVESMKEIIESKKENLSLNKTLKESLDTEISLPSHSFEIIYPKGHDSISNMFINDLTDSNIKAVVECYREFYDRDAIAKIKEGINNQSLLAARVVSYNIFVILNVTNDIGVDNKENLYSILRQMADYFKQTEILNNPRKYSDFFFMKET